MAGDAVATTDRLLLRSWTEADAIPLTEIASDPDAFEFVWTDFASLDGARALIADFNGREDGLGVTTWAIEERSSRALVGWCGFARTNAAWLNPDVVEIGWLLGPNYRGRGFATESARAALEIGAARLAGRRIISKCDVRNARSEAVMRRLELHRAGVVNGGEQPTVVYTFIAESR